MCVHVCVTEKVRKKSLEWAAQTLRKEGGGERKGREKNV